MGLHVTAKTLTYYILDWIQSWTINYLHCRFSFVLCCYQCLNSLTICCVQFVTLLQISCLLQKSTWNQQLLLCVFRVDCAQHRSGVVVACFVCCTSKRIPPIQLHSFPYFSYAFSYCYLFSLDFFYKGRHFLWSSLTSRGLTQRNFYWLIACLLVLCTASWALRFIISRKELPFPYHFHHYLLSINYNFLPLVMVPKQMRP